MNSLSSFSFRRNFHLRNFPVFRCLGVKLRVECVEFGV